MPKYLWGRKYFLCLLTIDMLLKGILFANLLPMVLAARNVASSWSLSATCRTKTVIRKLMYTSGARTTAMLTTATTGAAMKDEYGAMDSSGLTFSAPDFLLENGESLKIAEVSH